MTKRKLPSAVRWLAYLAIYAGFSSLMGSSASEILNSMLDLVLPLVFSVILALLFHELGYMLFARHSGYRFLSFRIGSYILISGKHEYSIKRWRHSLVPIQITMKPPQTDTNSYPFRLALWGGVIANLLVSGIVIILYFTVLPSSFLEILAAVNLAVILLEKFPGLNLLARVHLRKTMLASPVFRRLHWMEETLLASLAEGTRMKDMPDAWFEIPEHAENDQGYINGFWYYRAQRSLDQLDIRGAAEAFAKLVPEYAAALSKGFFASSLLFCKMIENPQDPQLKQIWETESLTQYHKQFSDYPAVLRVLYAYALLHDHDPNTAGKYLEAFEKCAKQFPYPGELETEYTLLRLIDERYEQLHP